MDAVLGVEYTQREGGEGGGLSNQVSRACAGDLISPANNSRQTHYLWRDSCITCAVTYQLSLPVT